MDTEYVNKKNNFDVVVLISGRGSNLESLCNNFEHDTTIRLVGVVSDNPEAPGLNIATRYTIPTTVVTRTGKHAKKKAFNDKLQQVVAAHNPQLIVLAGFMQVLSESFVNAFEGKIINIHPSLLPLFKGLNTHKRVLESGMKFSGCTVHYVTPKIDSGQIIAQAVIPLVAEDTEEDVANRVLRQEHVLLPRVIKMLAKNNQFKDYQVDKDAYLRSL